LSYSRAADEGVPTLMHIVVEKVAHDIAKRRRVEENTVLSMEKRKKGIKRCKRSQREVGVGAEEQGDGEGGGCEAGKDKEKCGGGGDEDVKSHITGIDSDPLATRAVRKGGNGRGRKGSRSNPRYHSSVLA